MFRVLLKILFVPVMLWLWLVIYLPFNKYSWADPPILDCDTDGEAATALLIYVIWFITAVLAARTFILKRKLGANFVTFALALAVTISLFAVFRYVELLQYDKAIASECGAP